MERKSNQQMYKALKKERSNVKKEGNDQKIKKLLFLCGRPNQG